MMSVNSPRDLGWLIPDARPEPKSEARERGRQIVKLLGAIEDVPVQKEIMLGQLETLDYFIGKATAGTLDMNDHDGLVRHVGYELAELTRADCRQMHRDKSAWKPMPKGWLGAVEGAVFCTKLHPKEIATMQNMRDELAWACDGLADAIPDWQRELADLQNVGPLPEDIATRLNLTVDGRRKA